MFSYFYTVYSCLISIAIYVVTLARKNGSSQLLGVSNKSNQYLLDCCIRVTALLGYLNIL